MSASTPLSRVCSSSLSTVSVNATPASSSKSTHRKSLKRLFTTDSRCTNNQQRKRHKSNTSNTSRIINYVYLCILSHVILSTLQQGTADCYEKVMSELCKLKMINPCCKSHVESLPYLMMEYVQIRFHTESKRFRNFHLSKIRTDMNFNIKMSRTASHGKKNE